MTGVSLRFVVDRREGRMLVIEDADGALRDVPAVELPAACRQEGAVIDVPSDGGTPHWSEAKRNYAEERRRVTEITEHMDRLRKTDPGGDVQL